MWNEENWLTDFNILLKSNFVLANTQFKYFCVSVFVHLKGKAYYNSRVQLCVSVLTLFCSSVYVTISKECDKLFGYVKCFIKT